MSRSVDLPDSVYAALEAAASAAGTTPAEWIAAKLPQPAPESEPESEGEAPRTLADEFGDYIGMFSSKEMDGSVCASSNLSPETEGTPRKTLAERLEGRVGLIHSGRSDLSERHSELFMEGLLEKRRTGHL